MASIRDVAKYAGVSITTVSRIINKDQSFSITKETKDKVYEAIAVLNYDIPDSYKSRKSKKNSIGCIQRLTIEGNKDNFFSIITSGVKEHLNTHGINLKFSFTQLDFDYNEFKNIFQTYPLGLILMGDVSEAAYNFLKSKIKHIVGIETTYDDIDSIRYNRFNAGIEAVTHLVEYPTAFYGEFDEDYAKLPKEVVITPMKHHQRYFPVLKDNKLLPNFIAVRNGDDHKIDNVKKGNDKVLEASLADALFFYKEDIKKPVESYIEKLNTVVFQDKLGTV